MLYDIAENSNGKAWINDSYNFKNLDFLTFTFYQLIFECCSANKSDWPSFYVVLFELLSIQIEEIIYLQYNQNQAGELCFHSK